MTNARPYSPAQSEAEAREEIQRCSGTQFDPVVVVALLDEVAVAARPAAPHRRRRLVVDPRVARILRRMARMRYSVGDKVLVSRDESGEDHEHGVVIDSYELIIGEERKPMVVVEFEDGERKYMTAATPNVLPVVEDDEDEEARGRGRAGGRGVEDAGGGPSEPEAEPSGNGEVFFVDDDEAPRPNGAGGARSRCDRLAWPPCTRPGPCGSRAASPRCSRAA